MLYSSGYVHILVDMYMLDFPSIITMLYILYTIYNNIYNNIHTHTHTESQRIAIFPISVSKLHLMNANRIIMVGATIFSQKSY